MKMPETPQNLEAYLNIPLKCSCGRTHYVPIKAVKIGPGAAGETAETVKSLGYKAPFILCDPITYKIAGKRIEDDFLAAGLKPTAHILTHLSFDEATLGEIVVNVPAECDLMVGVGTGSITDMTRYSSCRLNLPCFTVATGAPMDGFAASIGILNVNNIKKTLPAHCTEAIIGDTDILKTAPYRMTVAGFGDLIGKFTCLNDWELARIINGEHFCRNIVSLVKECVNDILNKAEKIKDRDPAVLGDVMNGLVLSGACISLYGDSRPASGAEHHMSHYWEAIKEMRREPQAMHGEQVAVGTVLVLMLAEEARNSKPDFAKARKAASEYDSAAWEAEIRRAYAEGAGEIIDLEKKTGKNALQGRLARIDSIEKHWDEITAQLATLPSAEYLYGLLKYIGCPAAPEDISVDDALLKDTFMYCKEIRPRYTIFQMLYDIDMLDSLSDRVIARIGKERTNN